jgi:hypothetical protein
MQLRLERDQESELFLLLLLAVFAVFDGHSTSVASLQGSVGGGNRRVRRSGTGDLHKHQHQGKNNVTHATLEKHAAVKRTSGCLPPRVVSSEEIMLFTCRPRVVDRM